MAGLRRRLAVGLVQAAASRGVLLARADRSAPVPFATWLHHARGEGRIGSALVLGGDPEPIRLLQECLGPQAVVVRSGSPAAADLSLASPDLVLSQIGPTASLAPTVDGKATPTVAVVYAQLGSFAAGTADTASVATWFEAHGFELQDIAGAPPPAGAAALTTNLYLIFERRSGAGRRAEAPGRGRRTAEALGLLSAPLAQPATARLTGGRGTDGFAGGMCNPGVTAGDGALVLIARGERVSWSEQRLSWETFGRSGQPVLLLWRPDFVGKPEPLDAGPWPDGTARAEDFRLFSAANRIFSNHSLIRRGKRRDLPIRPERLESRVGISEVDLSSRRIRFLGEPSLGRPLASAEKNWAMFPTPDGVALIYSLQPYRLHLSKAFPVLDFPARVEATLDYGPAFAELKLRNSINPVPWDEGHWLHLAHQVHPTKRYVFWALLIDRSSLRPVRISRRPVAHAASAPGAAMVYLSAASSGPDGLTLFGGVDDSSVASWTVPRAELEACWRPVK